jgi:hypothetical protein
MFVAIKNVFINNKERGEKMSKRIVSYVLVILMLVGIVLSLCNFIAVKAEAKVYWQDLEMGDDPHGGTYIRCWRTGQACCTVYPGRE